MKFARKFTVVPLTSIETPAGTDINNTLLSSLRINANPDDKIKVYNQALTKLRELSTEINQNDNMKQILDDFYTTVSKNNIEKVQSAQDIEKQIKEVETEAVKIEAAQNLKDYSKSEFNSVQFQKKPEFIPPLTAPTIKPKTLKKRVKKEDPNEEIYNQAESINKSDEELETTKKKKLSKTERAADKTKKLFDEFDKNAIETTLRPRTNTLNYIVASE